jgi:acetoacetate decarboxylase
MKYGEVCRMYELEWMYSAEGEGAESEVDYLILTAKGEPEHLRKLVPDLLEPGDDVFIYMGWWRQTVRDGEVRLGVPFHEWGVGIPSKLKSDPSKDGNFLVSLYVDNDLVMSHGREVWGYPKKFGRCDITPHPEEESSSYEYTVTRGGTQLVSGTLESLEPIAPEESPLNGVTHAICYKQIPAADSASLAIQQLVWIQVDFLTTEAKKGTGSISIDGGPFDQIPIGPLTDIESYLVRADFNHHHMARHIVDVEDLARPIDLSRAGRTSDGALAGAA